MAEEQLRRALELLQAGRFDEARAILQTLDHPTARKWLDRLDQMAAQAQASPEQAAEWMQAMQQAQVLIQQGRYDEARAIVQAIDHPMAQQMLATLDQLAAQSPPVPQAASAGAREAERPPQRSGQVEVRADGTRVRQTGTYEMLWDCQYCGATKLLGKTHRFCPNCGAAQNPDSRYFPSDEEKVAVEDHVYVGTDVTCPACDTLNSGNAEFCGNCGAPLTEGARARTLDDQVRAAGERFESSGSRDLAQERFDAEMERVGVKPRPQAGAGSNTRRNILIGLGVLVVLALCIGVIAGLLWTRESPVLVTGHSWERLVHIEQYGPQSENAWCDSMPGGAYNVSRRQEVRSHRQVPDGEECHTRRVDQGDGTYREVEECRTIYRDEPIYDDMCYYTIDRWAFSRTASASGNSVSDAPYWPQITLACAGQNRHGCERERDREEHYNVHFRESEGDGTYSCDFDQATWQGYRIETRWTAAVGVLTNQLQCDTLAPAG